MISTTFHPVGTGASLAAACAYHPVHMATIEGSTSAVLLKIVIDAGRARGLDVGRALSLAGTTESVLQDPVARVRRETGRVVWSELARQSGDPEFGLHLAEHNAAQGSGGVLEYAARTSATLGEAYGRVAELLRLVIEPAEARFVVERSVGWLTFRVGDKSVPADRHAAEFAVAWMLISARQGTGQTLIPAAVSFEHRAPSSVREHIRLFGVQPRFGASASGLAFRDAVLQLPLLASDPMLNQIVKTYASGLLAKMPAANDLGAMVRQQIIASIESGHSSESVVVGIVARNVRVSARTLQRRLSEAGTSVRQLLAEVRTELALAWLLEPGATAGTVAARLGFADQAAFNRAFRRWTGEAPGAYVRRLARSTPSETTHRPV